MLLRALLRLGLGDDAGARAAVEAELARMNYPESRKHPTLHRALRVAATIALDSGDAAAAEVLAGDEYVLAAARARDPAQSADVGQALLLRARARALLADRSGARSDLEKALPSLRNGLGANHPDTRAAVDLLERLAAARPG